MIAISHHWQQVYLNKDPDSLSWFQDRQQPSLELILAHRPDLSQQRFIDVGAGASRLVDALLDQGLASASLLDISEAALDISRARLEAKGHRDIDYLAQDIGRWRPDAPFDIWHYRAVFHFMVTDASQAAYKRALRAGTQPGSLLVVATFAPDGPQKCSGLPVQRWDKNALQGFLGADFAALATLEQAHTAHTTPGGTVQKFQFSVFERRA